MINTSYDILILGSGPAGLQAAIHAARRKAGVLILGRLPKSSAYGAHIDNYCCTTGSSGKEMLEQARIKAAESGAHFLEEDITDLIQKGSKFLIATESGKHIEAAAVIIAMGISRNKLGLQNEQRLVGRGISYCVDCDGGFFKNAHVAVIGSESAAVSGALTLLFFAKTVHLVCDVLNVNPVLAERLQESSVIIHPGRKAQAILGESSVTGLVLDDGSQLAVSGVFIELGAKGAVSLATNIGVDLDPETMKFIAVNRKQETNIPGIYAAGDICGQPWQIAKAVGEGCVAGLEAAAYVKKNRL